MVHGQLIHEGKVEKLTYRQLSALERVDARKEKQKVQGELARAAIENTGSVLSSGLTAVAALATGSGGYVLSLALIHLLEKTLKHNEQTDDLYDVTWIPVVTYGIGTIPTIANGQYYPPPASSIVTGQGLGVIGGGTTSFIPTPSTTTQLGQTQLPAQLLTMSGDQLAVFKEQLKSGGGYIIDVTPHTTRVGYLSTDEAILAKSLLTTAATSGVAGSLLGGLLGKK